MTVRIEKPALNLREEINRLDKPTGIAGEAMLRAETPQEQFNLISAGRRNILINGDFQVSQRGDFTTASSMPNAYKLDRWLCDRNGTATLQHTTGHDILGTPAICKAIKVVQTVTGTNYLGVRQKIENPSIYAGRTFTYSAWVRSNTRNARIECYVPGTTPNKYVGSSHSGNGQWEYLSFTFTINSGTPSDFLADVFIDNGVYGNTTITAGDYFECTMLQLELGKVATPFEHRSYGEELALCQRYYQVTQNFNGNGHSSGGVVGMVTLTGEMRATPAFSQNGVFKITDGYSNDWVQSSTGGILYTNTNKTNGYMLYIQNIASLTAGKHYHARCSDANVLQFDAEL